MVIYICYREKAKSYKRTKSDKEVCNELREFMSVIGLPENRVPTLKELSEHGRFVGSFLFSVMVGFLPLIPLVVRSQFCFLCHNFELNILIGDCL